MEDTSRGINTSGVVSTWRVQGHVFIGTILVDVTVEEPNGPGRAMVKRIIDGHLPYTLDLCTVGAMKQRKPEEPELTSLYSMDGNYVGSVNARFEDLLPHFIASRNPHQVNAEPSQPEPQP